MLSLAEGIVSRAVLKPVNRPGLAGDGNSATLHLLGSDPGPARIGLDTAETGTIRVDSEGCAAPETRADQINTQRASLRERVACIPAWGMAAPAVSTVDRSWAGATQEAPARIEMDW